MVGAFEDSSMVPLRGEGYYGLGSGLCCCVYASEIRVMFNKPSQTTQILRVQHVTA